MKLFKNVHILFKLRRLVDCGYTTKTYLKNDSILLVLSNLKE